MGSERDLGDVDLVLIDGDNLLYDVRGVRDEGGVAWLLPRLSGWRPEGVRIVVSLDGHPAPGEARRGRVMRGIEFHHSGSRSGDDMLIAMLASRGFGDRGRTVVVTRDRGLQARTRAAGGLTRSVDWLMRSIGGATQMGSGSSQAAKPAGIAQGKAPPARHFDPPDPDAEDRPSWEPGRGATRKRGNPRRKAKHLRRR